jgi:hypothetical protein
MTIFTLTAATTTISASNNNVNNNAIFRFSHAEGKT